MKSILLLVLSLSGSICPNLQKVSGTLDPSFGGSGTGFNLIDLGGTDDIDSIVDVQGRIIAGGDASGDVAIMRFNQDGTLDTIFGGNGTGFNIIDLGGSDFITSIALDAQGRIVAGGGAGASADVAIMRFTQDGTLDTTFGGNGTGFNLVELGGGFDFIRSIALDAQGRIVAGGQAGASADAAIMRFNQDGTLDTTFGGNGTGFNLIDLGGSDDITSIALDAQGRIVAGGDGGVDAVIMRFNQDGTLDTTFGGNGTGFNIIELGGGLDLITSIVLDAQGRIVAGGGSGADAAIMRFNQDGTLDTTFGGNGTGFNIIDLGGSSDPINSIALDAQGSIVAGGRGGTADAAIMRFNQDGTLDTTFGGNGTGFNIIFLSVSSDFISSIVLDAQGRIVAGGRVGVGDVFIMRLFNDQLTPLTVALREKYCNIG